MLLQFLSDELLEGGADMTLLTLLGPDEVERELSECRADPTVGDPEKLIGNFGMFDPGEGSECFRTGLGVSWLKL